MNKNALAALLDDLRTLILRSRPAYCDYLGKKVKTPEEIIASFLVPSEELEIKAGSSEFAGFAIGETYVLRIGDKKLTIVAEDSGHAEGAGLFYHANFSDLSVEDDGFVLFGGDGAFAGLFGSIYVGEQLTLSSAEVLADSWDIKKLPYELLPPQLCSTVDAVVKSIRSLQNNPVFVGSFSQNRMAGTDVGDYSHAEGLDNTASGESAHAEGRSTTASSYSSHAEGWETTASGDNSHAEGWSTVANNYHSHAEGHGSVASGESAHAEGDFTIASGRAQHAEGMWNIDDGAKSNLLHIVGNGTAVKRSNAHTLDKSGNAWYAGDVYVGSTSGTNRDAGSKKLATEAYVDDTKLVIASPGGKKFKITVDDTGALSATEVTDTTT